MIPHPSTIVLQSSSPTAAMWIQGCQATVSRWASARDYDYAHCGDELFDALPESYRGKISERKPILADLARLLWIERCLADGYQTAIWIDADTLCVDEEWEPDLVTVAGFGYECWVERTAQGVWRRFQTPHNGFMVFAAESPVLPFLSYLTQSIIERASPAHIAPQMVGPKLLKALNNLAAFTLYHQAGALSPALIAELADGPAEAIACYRAGGAPRPAMVNLCASLAKTRECMAAREALLASPEVIYWLGSEGRG